MDLRTQVERARCRCRSACRGRSHNRDFSPALRRSNLLIHQGVASQLALATTCWYGGWLRARRENGDELNIANALSEE